MTYYCFFFSMSLSKTLICIIGLLLALSVLSVGTKYFSLRLMSWVVSIFSGNQSANLSFLEALSAKFLLSFSLRS